jgi:RNA polymerase sigma-70 factor (ECF subfamily)
MERAPDEQLVAIYLKRRDERALEELVRRSLPVVIRYLKTLTGNADTAADIAQETFVKAWKHLPRFDARTSFRSWLFTIAKRTAIDELRKRHALPFSAIVTPNGADYAEALISDMPSPLESAHAARREAFVASAVGQLSDSHATIVRLRIVDDLTFSQISHTLGTPLNTVKSAYRRAVTQLRGFLDADDVR